MSDTSAATLHVEEAGNPDGPPILMVHGFLSSNAQWDLNRDALGERYRLLMVELVGHGGSAAPTEAEAYSIDAHVAGFEKIRRDCGIDRWWVCGQSLGGAISILYCLSMPEHVHGLIFTNSRAAFGIKRQGVSSDPKAPPLRIESTRDMPVHPINAKRLDEAVKARMVAAADAMPVHAANHFLARRHTWDSTARMHELTMPVLLVNGRWESAFQPFAQQAATLIPDFETVELDGGHAINAENPDGFNAAALDFLARRNPAEKET